MSLIKKRTPRPLTRTTSQYRDDRLFLVACDDTYAPVQYFESFRLERVKVHVVPTEDGTSTAPRVLDRVLDIEIAKEWDERWILLDTDHYINGTHLASYTDALQRARQANVSVALSNPCFELWLLLHHVGIEQAEALRNAKEVAEALRNVLGSYDKTALSQQNFPLDAVAMACQRARALDEKVRGGDIPQAATTRVYKLVEAIAGSVSEMQVPEALRPLRNA